MQLAEFGDEEGGDPNARQVHSFIRNFWLEQNDLMEQLEITSEQSFKNHNDLPLARIKRIMKSDEDVRMISAEAPVLFAKACELFILELTLRSWIFSEQSKRKTLQKEDIIAAIHNTENFDFLVESVCKQQMPPQQLGHSQPPPNL